MREASPQYYNEQIGQLLAAKDGCQDILALKVVGIGERIQILHLILVAIFNWYVVRFLQTKKWFSFTKNVVIYVRAYDAFLI
jgi:hypothetical protein